jgi:hypothetical protein
MASGLTLPGLCQRFQLRSGFPHDAKQPFGHSTARGIGRAEN